MITQSNGLAEGYLMLETDKAYICLERAVRSPEAWAEVLKVTRLGRTGRVFITQEAEI